MAPPGTFRVLGRLGDLRRIDPHLRLDRLDMNPLRWRLSVNRSWLDESIRRGEPFLVLSTRVFAGTVFAWELKYLRLAGYRQVGCWLVPRESMKVDLSWMDAPPEQAAMLQAVADGALAGTSPDLRGVIESLAGRNKRGEFEAKVRHEIEPFLALAPYVVGAPFRGPASGRLLLGLRAVPIHVLGMTDKHEWADGRLCSPAEYFFHDLDHARFKVREDLLALGYECPDAYPVDHGILLHALALVREAGPRLWELAPARLAFARRVLDALAALQSRDGTLGDAAELFLLEIVHEKSYPMDSRVILRELGNDAHLEKLRRKCAAGFYGPDGPRDEVTARFDEARACLIPLVAAAA